ncbi:phage tail protein [Mesorhizobium sp. WSM4906]|uniref:phage tail protein n=1 Tax=Mesorhizobium sp. WSM4906 TaxID=3038546 RepID=UPI002416A5F1|nr:phage tail protein [Mesorhizobium sp. WSM4906]WFP74491.1 phage tail protein [Mesorhizobium sp. WSM4906]
MTDPVFGITIRRDANESAVPSNALMSVVGICMPFAKAATATQAAFDAAFPAGVAVRLNSNDATKLALCDPDSLFIDAVEGINAQLGPYQVAAQLVVNRVAEGADIAATIANIVGSSVAGTGIHAFVNAGADLGVYPRLILVPGYTTQQFGALTALALTTQGTNMTAAPDVVFTGGGADPNKVLPTAHAVMGTGPDAQKVASLVIDTAGAYLSAPLNVSFTGGGADAGKVLPTATATVEELANAVCAALPEVLNKILAVAIVDGPNGLAAFTQWRETLSSDRLIPVTPGIKRLDASGDVVTRPAAPRIAGVAVRRDYENDGRPFRSWANQALYGIVGPEQNYRFSLTDGSTEGQEILAAQGGIIVRGDSGDDFAIAEGGFVYIGTDNLSDQTIWQQYHKVRGRDFIELTCLRTLRQYLGKFNLTTQTIQSVVNTVHDILAKAEANGDILGFKCRFDPELNNAQDLRAGHIYIDAQFEEAPVFRRLTMTSRPYAPALQATIDELISRQNLIS